MAATDQAEIVWLGADDAPAGLALSTEAHWNQNEADWRFFLTKGEVFGVRDSSGLLIASAALLPYSSDNAWISMVLVTESWRRRGLATRLVDACLATAAKQGFTTWLDATPAGATVYGPLGFAPTLQLRRLRLEGARVEAPPLLSPYDIEEFIARDTSAMSFGRATLLRELGARPGSRLLSNGKAAALVRDGRKARHIGPVFADRPEQALAIVNAIVRSDSATFLIDAVDAVDAQQTFLQGLTDSGWNIERPFQRMRFDRASAQTAKPPFAVAGPEYG
jgi:GNAT superfamily N-acetyltransferase